MFACFLDASKAFDRVNHTKLYETLSHKGVFSYLLRILVFLVCKLIQNGVMGAVQKDSFKVTNGVRQGVCYFPFFITCAWISCPIGKITLYRCVGMLFTK